MGTHYRLDEQDQKKLGNGWSEARVLLEAGDTADNPASTKGPIYGPALVTYRTSPCGAIDTYVEPPA